MTDAYGNVVATYTYGVYGELLSGNADLTHFLYNGRCGVSTDENGLYYMRQRYYNPEIKRFVNQDILTGSLTNSQSLNRYSYVQGNPVSYTDPFGLSPVNGLFSNTNFAHSMLGLLSCIPGVVGSAASALDGMVYAIVDKDYSMAALSFMDVLAFGIGKIGSRLVKADKLTNTAQLMINTSNLLSNAASFGMCADAAMATGFDMYNKYYILGQSVDSDTKWEVLSLGMSVLGSVVSAKGMSKSTKELSDLLQKEGFTNALKEEVFGLANGFKRTPDIMSGGSGMGMNLQFFGGGKTSYGKSSGKASAFSDLPWYEQPRNTTGTGRARNNIGPNKNANGKHVVYKVDPQTGKVTNYKVYDVNPKNPSGFDEILGYDGVGKPHKNPVTGEYLMPHMHDDTVPGKARIPNPDEIPD